MEASVVLASVDVGGVPRVEGKGHAKPAEVASRLFSMGETVNQKKVRTKPKAGPTKNISRRVKLAREGETTSAQAKQVREIP